VLEFSQPGDKIARFPRKFILTYETSHIHIPGNTKLKSCSSLYTRESVSKNYTPCDFVSSSSNFLADVPDMRT